MNNQSTLFSLNPVMITMYSVSWCPDCRRAKDFFNRYNIEYQNVDVDEILEAASFVKELNNGKRVVPTIIFPSGEILVEPSDEQLAKKFGV